MAKIQICTPLGDGKVPVQMATFLYALLKATKHDIRITHVARCDISHARNRMITDFLLTDSDYLLFLDDDNPPESPDFLDKMLESKKPVITALVPSRLPDGEGKHRLCIFKEGIKEDGRHEYLQQFTIPEGPEIMEIANCGMGCVLIEREVVELVSKEFDRPCEMRMVTYYQMDDEWIRDERVDYTKIKDGTLRFKRYVSEDLLFFERAKEFGIKIWAHKGVRCEHIGDPRIISITKNIGH